MKAYSAITTKIIERVLKGIFVSLLFAGNIKSQDSPAPSLNSFNYKNTVSFDSDRNVCRFSYSGKDCSIDYLYDMSKGYSLNALTVHSQGLEFYPSFFGGPAVKDQFNNDYYVWSEGMEFENLNFELSDNTLSSEWVMKKADDFYFHFRYKISISGKTLTINVKDLGRIDPNERSHYSSCFSFQLDRCENALNPVIVKIPYLTMFGILYTKGLFTSAYFDWTKTNSSQIYPENKKFSYNSVYFSQNTVYYPKTNGRYNPLEETIYLTVSPDITETFPNIPNQVSRYKNLSVNHVVYDIWDQGFSKILKNTKKLVNSGHKKLWLIVHDWQNGGYDNKLPEVLPSNPKFGGDTELKKLSSYCNSNNLLFSLHENYTDFYPNGIFFNNEHVGLSPSREMIKAWKNHHGQSYLLKPSHINHYISQISDEVNSTFQTNSSFIDVIAARNPSDYIDYDFNVVDAGKFVGTFNFYKKTADLLRNIHKGPVSSEGYNHFIYSGIFDDITPQIQTSDSIELQGKSGYYLPLIVDFDLLKMQSKAMVHGVGYLERFFLKGDYWQHMGRSFDSLLIYAATEIAYGHGGFIQSNSYNPGEMAKIEYGYVYPLQLLYGNSKVKKILYNNNNRLVTLSDYIKSFPKSFNNFNSKDFLAQVYIEYANGLKIYVNRHPSKVWKINFNKNQTGWFNYHAELKGKKVLKKTSKNPVTVTLPHSNGWICYSPVKPK